MLQKQNLLKRSESGVGPAHIRNQILRFLDGLPNITNHSAAIPDPSCAPRRRFSVERNLP
jgi:hypothetical protein